MRNSSLVFMAIFMVAIVNTLPIFVGSIETVLLSGAAGLLAVIGAYTGLDFAAIAEGTRNLPKGQFIRTDKSKYLSMIFFLFIITIECAVVGTITKTFSNNVTALYLFATLSIMAVYIGGMKVNKKATQENKRE